MLVYLLQSVGLGPTQKQHQGDEYNSKQRELKEVGALAQEIQTTWPRPSSLVNHWVHSVPSPEPGQARPDYSPCSTLYLRRVWPAASPLAPPAGEQSPASWGRHFIFVSQLKTRQIPLH